MAFLATTTDFIFDHSGNCIVLLPSVSAIDTFAPPSCETNIYVSSPSWPLYVVPATVGTIMSFLSENLMPFIIPL